jgi:protocatechuate 3,4-dioxygenase alpha subunit
MRVDAACDVLAGASTEGVRIRVEGQMRDGDGAPVPDAVLELWQANHHGRYNHPSDTRPLPLDPAFTGYGRVATDRGGRFCFTTVKPGAVPFDDRRTQAPHVCVAVLGRGLLNHLYTRVYFDDEPANETDPVLACVPAERRDTLVARRAGDGGAEAVYRIDLVLQGAGETVFFDLRG